jgi:hypothetical protein
LFEGVALMKRSVLLAISIVIAIVLLIAAIFTKDWIFYLLIACLVFAVSIIGSRKRKQK